MNLVEMALADLSGAETFPLDALMTLRQKWSDARGPLLAALNAFASGADRSPENAEKVFFGLHLMAEKREAEAWAPLLSVAMEGEALYDMIGDAAVGNPAGHSAQPLFRRSRRAEEADRGAGRRRMGAGRGAGSLLRAGGQWRNSAGGRQEPISRNASRRCSRAKPTRSGMAGRAASRCSACRELEPSVARAFRQGLVDKNVLSFEDFQAELRANRAASDRRELFEERGIKPIDDALDALSVVRGGRGRGRAGRARGKQVPRRRPQRPVPLRERQEIQEVLSGRGVSGQDLSSAENPLGQPDQRRRDRVEAAAGAFDALHQIRAARKLLVERRHGLGAVGAVVGEPDVEHARPGQRQALAVSAFRAGLRCSAPPPPA